jgi:hypothetical protein
MIIHVVNNSLSFLDLGDQTNAVCLIVLIGSLLLLAFALWWFAKRSKKQEVNV